MPVIPTILFPYVSTYPILHIVSQTLSRAIPASVAVNAHPEIAGLVHFLQFHPSSAPGALAAALKLKAEYDLVVVSGGGVAVSDQGLPEALLAITKRIDALEHTLEQRLSDHEGVMQDRLSRFEGDMEHRIDRMSPLNS